VPVKKRTPWHPRPDGQGRTERPGAREWFSDRLFVEATDDHWRSGFSASAVVHACAAVVVAATVVAQTVHIPIVRASTSPLVMPAMLIDARVAPTPPPRRPASQAALSKAKPPFSQPPATPAAADAAAAPLTAPAGVAPDTSGDAGAGETSGAIDGILGGLPGASDQPIGAPGADAAGPYRVGGTIKPPRRIRDVRPWYPMEALQSRAHGNVVIEATIGVDGRVERAVVVQSIPLLDQAAVDAVKQWEYTPSIMNGLAVPVVMLVVVNFTIQ
jgi:protein TonB